MNDRTQGKKDAKFLRQAATGPLSRMTIERLDWWQASAGQQPRPLHPIRASKQRGMNAGEEPLTSAAADPPLHFSSELLELRPAAEERKRPTFKMSHDRGWRGSCCSEHET